jgi:type IX secretion system PorP/SprF family membrane protein
MFKIRHLLVVILITFSSGLFAQQEIQLTQFMFNQMTFNPGYAGARDAICSNILGRQQWIGFQDGEDDVFPTTYLLTVDAPIDAINSGLGLMLMQDQLGFEKSLQVKINYAYHFNVGPGRLGIGANIGLTDKTIDFTKFRPLDEGDPLLNGGQESDMLMDFGFGAYFSVPDQFYAGIASSQLLEDEYTNTSDNTTPYSLKRHYYMVGGYYYTLPDPSFVLNPNVLIKSDFASTQFDINATVMYNNKYWGGVTYRASDAIGILVGGYPFESEKLASLRIGYAYDVTTSPLGSQGRSGGSHEIFLSYCFKVVIKRIPSSYSNVRFL